MATQGWTCHLWFWINVESPKALLTVAIPAAHVVDLACWQTPEPQCHSFWVRKDVCGGPRQLLQIGRITCVHDKDQGLNVNCCGSAFLATVVGGGKERAEKQPNLYMSILDKLNFVSSPDCKEEKASEETAEF